MAMGGRQDRINSGKFRIGSARVLGDRDRLFVALSQGCRPAFADMPDHHHPAARALADRLLEMRHGGLVIASETIACAEIAAGELRIRVEVEGAKEAAAPLLLAAPR